MLYGSSTSSAGLRSRPRPGVLPPTIDAQDEVTEPLGRPYSQQIDWVRLGVFGAGVALGALIGSGAALLLAPESGEETRDRLRRRARSIRGGAHDAWDELRADLAWAARRSRKRMRRGLTRGGWAAEDLLDRGRRRAGAK
jgi:hypothetical protein